ncbi:MAG: nucleotide sugar dehydrogenase, partial [Methanomassiliicoccales archaeon]|nr:nucleotide sugar dehydrogenase [Methanomassiliicoccales archaeon]
MQSLQGKIRNGKAVIGIMGLGYVGLPLALAFAKRFDTIGFDVNEKIVKGLSKGTSHIGDVADSDIAAVIGKSFHPTTDASRLRRCDFIIVCVPTPLKENGEPDLAYLKAAASQIRDVLHKDMFVIIESTTYPGTTDGLIRSILEQTKLKAGKDFGLAFSPERIDPGNPRYKVTQIPKVVGGIDKQSTETAFALYSTVIEKVYPVSNARTAEAVKMMENIFRNVNIALVNEMALVFERMEIDSWEVIEAAKTKP